MTATEVHAISIAGNKRASKYQDFFDQLDHGTSQWSQATIVTETPALSLWIAIERAYAGRCASIER